MKAGKLGTVVKPGDDPQVHTLAVGDRVRNAWDEEGEITDNDGAGFTVTWDKNGEGSGEYHDHYDDGAEWPFDIIWLEEIA